jgi:hypothetical protein
MKRLLIAAVLALNPVCSMAFEIFAIGTSNTNCKGVDRARSFTVHLQELLRAEGFDAIVTNSGVDGDKPIWMSTRLFGASGISENTKLVIFEPGPNDRNISSNVEYSEKVLARLRERNMPTIYVSSAVIQKSDEARATAQKYGAYYYGHWSKDVPLDRVHRQYDMVGGGHLTAEGCQLVARNMLAFVKSVLEEKNIKPTATPSPPRAAI